MYKREGNKEKLVVKHKFGMKVNRLLDCESYYVNGPQIDFRLQDQNTLVQVRCNYGFM